MDVKYYRVELIDDKTKQESKIFMAALDNPKEILRFIDGMRVFWVVELSYEQYVEQIIRG